MHIFILYKLLNRFYCHSFCISNAIIIHKFEQYNRHMNLVKCRQFEIHHLEIFVSSHLNVYFINKCSFINMCGMQNTKFTNLFQLNNCISFTCSMLHVKNKLNIFLNYSFLFDTSTRANQPFFICWKSLASFVLHNMYKVIRPFSTTK